MKSSKRILSIIIPAAILVSGCEKSGADQSHDERTITVTAGVVSQTKAGYESGVLLPEKFFMDIIQGDDAKYNYTLVEMTKEAGGNTYSAPEGTKLLWADENYSASVKAMTVPYGLSAVTDDGVMEVNVSLQQDDAANVAASDLLGATSAVNGGVTIDEGVINVTFSHLLSKLNVNYTFSSEFANNTKSVNSLTLKNICTTGGFSYADMSYDKTDLDYGDVTMYLDPTKSTAEAIFFPYNPSENPILSINATIDGEECTFTCPVVAKSADGFVGGKRYTMNVTIVGTTVSETLATIAQGWDTDTKEESFVTEK